MVMGVEVRRGGRPSARKRSICAATSRSTSSAFASGRGLARVADEAAAGVHERAPRVSGGRA